MYTSPNMLLYNYGIVVGETGIGKSTLLDTLFNMRFDSVPASHDQQCVKLKANTYG